MERIQNLINVAYFNKTADPKNTPKFNKRTPMFIPNSRVSQKIIRKIKKHIDPHPKTLMPLDLATVPALEGYVIMRSHGCVTSGLVS